MTTSPQTAAGRVVFAHGFTQTSRSWANIERLLAERVTSVQTVAVDLPGHGTASDVDTDLWGAADHLVAEGGRGTYVGYSMGGRVSLHAALQHPGHVERLVLIGATAGIVDDDQRRERRRSDEQLAQRIEAEPLAGFIDSWLSLPLFAGLTPTTAQRDDRLTNTAAGLASSLRHCGTGTQEPLWDRLPEIVAPTLVLAGQHDAKFCALGERLASTLPNARFEIVPESGHSVHLEQPEATVDALVGFITGD